MTPARCVADVASELGLDKEDVQQIADALAKRKKLLDAQGKAGRVEDDLRKFASGEAEKAQIAAALRRKQAALNIIHRDEWERSITRLRAGGLSREEAVVANLVGSYEGIAGARKSTAQRRIGLEADYLGGMLSDIYKEAPHLVPLFQDPRNAVQVLDDTVREMHELKPDGKPGITKNADAKILAGIISKYDEAARLELNRAGANIGHLDGWAPQNDDRIKVRRAGPDAWIQATLPLLDREKTFGTRGPDEIRDTMTEVWSTLATGRDGQITPVQKGQKVGPANLARSLEQHRVLHFKDADAQLAYAKQFSRGNVLTATIDHLHHSARTISLMQTMGPNPQTFLEALLGDMQQEARGKVATEGEAAAKSTGRLRLHSGGKLTGLSKIGKAFAEVTGQTGIPVSSDVHRIPSWVPIVGDRYVSSAQIGAGVRALQNMTKLGGVTVTSFNDLAVFASRMRFQGKPLLKGYGDSLKSLFAGRTLEERRQLALAIGVTHDAILGDIHARFNAQDNLPGIMSRAQNAFFKLSGIVAWTERLEAGFGRLSSAWMADKARLDWNGLDAQYRHVLGLHGIDEGRWQVIRQIVSDEADGHRYVLPGNVANLPDEAFSHLSADPARMAAAKRDLELDLHSFFADEAMFAVLRGDDRTRMVLTQGTAPGDMKGEAIRFIMQFKSWTTAYAQKLLLARQGISRTYDKSQLAWLIAGSTILGYASMTVKDLARNKTPRQFGTPGEIAQTTLAAMLQGGGLGIYGDFLFGNASRMGGGFTDTLLGPTYGTVGDLINLAQAGRSTAQAKALGEPNPPEGFHASDAIRIGLQNAPFVNLIYTRAALDLLVLNDLQEWASPGTFKRREQAMKRDYGQRFIVDPLHPSRAFH